ncbi:MAG: SUMF1/EgtB/PvdO family nonheme iron enzyme, partial [Gemmataceae bacterium]|nr:SUMF1/EgtB/PvdO family nonheme iron enzyme [Gemmataceae bacterium]
MAKKEEPKPVASPGRKIGGAQGEVRQRAEVAHQAACAHEQGGEYAEAAALIEPVPEHLQQPSYLASLRQREKEAADLEAELTDLDAKGLVKPWHRSKILRLKELVPPLDVSELLRHAPDTIPSEYAIPSLNAPRVLVPPGRSWLGGGDGKCGDREVRIERPYYVGVHPVTQGQWKALMGSNPSKFQGDDQCPVEQVSWDDCQEFLVELNRREKAGSGWTCRLPTAEEWEYSVRSPVPSSAQEAQAHCGASFYAPGPTNTVSDKQA